jgi:hypothetical protein
MEEEEAIDDEKKMGNNGGCGYTGMKRLDAGDAHAIERCYRRGSDFGVT